MINCKLPSPCKGVKGEPKRKKDKENLDENQDDDWLDFACDLTEKDTLEQVLGLYYKKHNKEKTA